MNKISTKTLFDHLNQINKFKKNNYWELLTDSDKKSWSTYMILRYLSMNIDNCIIINELQKYNIDDKNMYNLLVNIIPKTNKFTKYIKKQSNNKNIYIDFISNYYKCSKKEAHEYYLILDNNKLIEIKDSFGNNGE